MRGLNHYKRAIRTQDGRSVHLYFHCNVLITPDLNITEFPKSIPPAFTSFDNYMKFLNGAIADVQKNASASGRMVRYEPLATLSSGYDSPACAVLAKQVGCREAVTFTDARPGYASLEDSGAEIGRALGLQVTTFSRLDYLNMPRFPEAEFLAYGAGGEEVVFAPLEDILKGKLFFTGYLGDTVWNKNLRRTNHDLLMVYPGGSSFGEFRLRVGFVHFPLPAAGYIQHASIHQISNSSELAPWSVANPDYDRPIPRRLVEEAGVPRALFGQDKKAITQPLWNVEQLDAVMSPESFRDFSEFARHIPLFKNSFERLRYRVMQFLYKLNLRILWRLHAEERTWIPERFTQERGPASLTFHWGFLKTMERYRMAIDADEKLKRVAPVALRTRIKRWAPEPLLLLYRLIRQGRAQDIASSLRFLFMPLSGASFRERLDLLEHIYATSAAVDCEHTQEEMLTFLRTILSLPSGMKGCIVEAGCFKGGSTAKFSWAAAKARRDLVVFDSFAGLPENTERHEKTIFGERPDFSMGKYEGTLPEVQENVRRWGRPDVCRFIKGWFEDTMPGFSEPIAAGYLDVDLLSSTKTCLKSLYPRLAPGGVLYSQDAHLPLIIKLLNDERFWIEEVGCPKPRIEGLGKQKLVRIRKPVTSLS
jgi:hypothetical protein